MKLQDFEEFLRRGQSAQAAVDAEITKANKYQPAHTDCICGIRDNDQDRNCPVHFPKGTKEK